MPQNCTPMQLFPGAVVGSPRLVSGRCRRPVIPANAGMTTDYLASAFRASLMPSLTPTSVGRLFKASAASRSL